MKLGSSHLTFSLSIIYYMTLPNFNIAKGLVLFPTSCISTPTQDFISVPLCGFRGDIWFKGLDLLPTSCILNSLIIYLVCLYASTKY